MISDEPLGGLTPEAAGVWSKARSSVLDELRIITTQFEATQEESENV